MSRESLTVSYGTAPTVQARCPVWTSPADFPQRFSYAESDPSMESLGAFLAWRGSLDLDWMSWV